MGIQDFLQLNKLRNIFNPDENPSPPSPYGKVVFGGDEPEPDVLPSRELRQNIFDEPEEEDEISALDQFRESVLNPPQRDKFGSKTNILRMLGTGALSAAQGEKGWGEKPFNIAQTEAIMNTPYEKKVADWEMRSKGLGEAAKIESTRMGREELAALRRSQIPREERLGREGETRLDQAQQRVDILRDKASKNTLTDREKIELQGMIRSGQIDQQGNIRSGQIEQQGKQRLEQIGATGDERLEQIGAQGRERTGQISQAAEEARRTKQVIPGKNLGSTETNKPESATQTKTRLQLRANEYIQAHPEHSEFVQINPNTGMVDITPPSTNWYGGTSGPDDKTYKEMVLYMKGGVKTPVEEKTDKTAPVKLPSKNVGSVVEPPNSGKVLTKTQRNPRTGATRVVESTDGGKTWSVKK